MKRRVFSRVDALVLAGLVAAILVLWALHARAPGAALSLRVDGAEIARLDLSRDGDYPVETAYGRNLVRIESGAAFVAEADCPNGDCMRGRIARAGESLACLPHHLTLVVVGEGGVDAVSGP